MNAPGPGVRAPGRVAWRRTLLGLFGLVLLVTIPCILLAGSTPAWFGAAAHPMAGVPSVSSGVGESLENSLVSALTAPPFAQAEQTWTASPEQLNAWLSERLPQWIANRSTHWPADVSLPCALFEPGSITLAVAAPVAGRRCMIGATLAIDGSGTSPVVRLSSLDVGRLRLPAWCTLQLIRNTLDTQHNPVLADLLDRALRGIPLGPVRLDDGRIVTFSSLTVDSSGVRLVLAQSPARATKRR